MDVQSIPQNQISDNSKSSSPKLIYIALGALILIILTAIFSIATVRNVGFKQTSKTTAAYSPTPPAIKRITYKPSSDLTTQDGITFFAGEVIDKEETFLQVKGREKTLKFAISGKIYFIEAPIILTVSIQDFKRTQPKIIDYNSLKKGDLVSISVKLVGNSQVAIGGLVFK